MIFRPCGKNEERPRRRWDEPRAGDIVGAAVSKRRPCNNSRKISRRVCSRRKEGLSRNAKTLSAVSPGESARRTRPPKSRGLRRRQRYRNYSPTIGREHRLPSSILRFDCLRWLSRGREHHGQTIAVAKLDAAERERERESLAGCSRREED